MTEDVRKLLAGYATNTLTEAERRELFDASLNDSELFEALADEQVLRDLLDDPAARAELLRRIEPAPASFRDRFAAWLRRPAAVAALGTAAVAITVISLVPLLRKTPVPQPVEMAKVQRAPKIAAPAAPAPVARVAVPQEMKAKSVGERDAETRQFAAPGMAPLRKEEKSDAPKELIAAEAPSMEARAKLADEAAPANLPAAAVMSPPPAPLKAAKKAAALTYVVLKRMPNGDYLEVPRTNEFDSGDVVRLRIETATPGPVAVIEAGRPTALFRQQSPGTIETGDILLTADKHLEIAVLPANAPAASGMMGGVVGGVPGYARERQAAAPTFSAQRISQPPTVEVHLRVKKP